MKKIEVSELTDNVFTTIGKEWMLVTAGTKDKFNMMTASWGCLGWLWNKPVAVMFIRPERYTHELIEQGEHRAGGCKGSARPRLHQPGRRSLPTLRQVSGNVPSGRIAVMQRIGI